MNADTVILPAERRTSSNANSPERKPPPAPARAYPTEALGDVLGPAAGAIATKVQCAPALAAQSVLTVASLAAQAIADARLPHGQVRPLSLFALTVASSGDRKSTADGEAMAPVRIREEALREAHRPLAELHKVRHAAWRAQRAQIERALSDVATREADLQALGPEPEPPVEPVLIVSDTTHEGLARHMARLPGAIGVFSAEGGQFLSGHGFTAEKKLATAASFAALWDGDGFRRLRAGDGLIDHRGRRLATHLMVQPDAAAAVLRDPVLRDQGLLARLLVAAPETLAGDRLWREPSETIEPALRRYIARMASVFEAPVRARNGAGNELDPRVLEMSASARPVWIALHDEIEREMAPRGRFEGLRDVAGKIPEQAARIAGVLTIIDDREAIEIGGDTMRRACDLARWYLDEALRLMSEAAIAPEVAYGDALLAWMKATGRRSIAVRDIMRLGPPRLRKREVAQTAIDVLVEAGDLTPADEKRKHWTVAVR